MHVGQTGKITNDNTSEVCVATEKDIDICVDFDVEYVEEEVVAVEVVLVVVVEGVVVVEEVVVGLEVVVDQDVVVGDALVVKRHYENEKGYSTSLITVMVSDGNYKNNAKHTTSMLREKWANCTPITVIDNCRNDIKSETPTHSYPTTTLR
ncbi:hypothetical protein DPMN_182800 [Dreissena polymorpha]|uniref:Uncharacterized protein n=1 Tax=Dreissena polymorpha TaxID=45954 RepID=A0A9D4DHU8_DREPO|nr:hypothetical protein DPMN_182800 [Dreissena polymorpha]